jgi:hypothetical protein
MSNKLKILVIILVVVAALLVYSLLSSLDSNDEKNLIAAGNVAGKNEPGSFSEGEEVLLMLKRLKSVKMDTDFFEDKIFKNLSDFSVKINPEPVGRVNPFAPI